ncbi:hypothetical protein [Microbacterium sp. LWH10-1.2]|uniref:hypothetical protein n=1 Tax=unclassified Microbacterium TaxID=2609290 RepID=UPI00313A2348
MHWDRLFDDLEGQLAAEWEAERATLDAESERLRISRLDLRSRLRLLCAEGTAVTLDLPGIGRCGLLLRSLGADWTAATVTAADGASAAATVRIVPLHAIRGLATDHGSLLGSLDDSAGQERSMRERMTLGFILRDLARRRVPVHLTTIDGERLHGTVDRAGSDHLDLAVHDRGTARRASAVHGFRIVPFTALSAVDLSGDQLP